MMLSIADVILVAVLMVILFVLNRMHGAVHTLNSRVTILSDQVRRANKSASRTATILHEHLKADASGPGMDEIEIDLVDDPELEKRAAALDKQVRALMGERVTK